MEFLRDPLVQFFIYTGVTLIGVILAGIIPWMIYRKQQMHREIAYEVISNTSVLPETEEKGELVKGVLHVLFQGKPIKGARLVILKIWNAGNVQIVRDDFETPIIFEFGEKAEVLNVAILETTGVAKSKAEEALKMIAGNVMIESLLLNSEATIKLKVLLMGFGDSDKITTSNTIISGVKKIEEVNTSMRLSKRMRMQMMTIIGLLLLLFKIRRVLGRHHAFFTTKTQITLSSPTVFIASSLIKKNHFLSQSKLLHASQ